RKTAYEFFTWLEFIRVLFRSRLFVKGSPEHVLASPELSQAYGWQFHRSPHGGPVHLVPSITPAPVEDVEEEGATQLASLGEEVRSEERRVGKQGRHSRTTQED